MSRFTNDAVTIEPAKGYATFEQRSDTEAKALPIIRDYINSLEATVALEDADVETQKRDDIDFIWTRSHKARTERLTLEVKVDTQIHETGNFAFETISNELAATVGCFMRSNADYFYYYASETSDLWIFDLKVVRSWFRAEMRKNAEQFTAFRTFTKKSDGGISVARGYLVPKKRLENYLGNKLRYRNIKPKPDVEAMIAEVFDYTLYDDSPFE